MSQIAPATHRRLSATEIAQYHRDGFIVIEPFLPANEVGQINAEMDRLREDLGALPAGLDAEKEADKTFILRLGLRSNLTRSLCEDERILDLISDVVSPGIAIYSSKLVEKMPRDPEVCHWHQDDAYYRQHSESACRMSIWLPLQDCDERNGCLWVVPGSHHWGLREASNFKRSSGHCNLCFAHGSESMEGAVPVRVKAGSIILFHALTWHRSLGNETDHVRRAFIVSYQEATAIRGNRDQHKILRTA